METYDIKKAHRNLYSAPKGDFVVLDVPALRYVMVDGQGDPNRSPAYREAVEALYTASYTLKFMSKSDAARDYVVPPLEGLWWSADLSDFAARRKEKWSWTMMIAVPDFVPPDMAERAIDRARSKKAMPALSRLRFDRLDEGRVVQTLHIGSYDDEGPVLARLHREFLPAHRLVEAGHHHEIYLSDPRRTAPAKLKTLLRQPVTSAA